MQLMKVVAAVQGAGFHELSRYHFGNLFHRTGFKTT